MKTMIDKSQHSVHPTQLTGNKRIIKIAGAIRRANCGNADDLKHLKDQLSRVSQLDKEPAGTLIWSAYKFLSGEPFVVVTSNPQTVERFRSLADELGATLEEDADDPRLEQFEMTGAMKLMLWCPASAELLRMFEKIKGEAGNAFLKDGRIAPNFFLEFEHDSGEGRFAQILCGWSGDDEKKKIFAEIKKKNQEHGRLVRYCFAAEVWMAPANSVVRAKDSPERTERVMVIAEERGARPLFAVCEIERHVLPLVPTLGNWTYDRGRTGPLFDLLNDDGPAAEGRTFQ
jgi:hypothetical protein